jgi:pimeloyl-ACP methyl ester carboxylesterase
MTELVADVLGEGPPVVLLHGQPGSRVDWALVARRLRADFTVIVPDRPGYGQTGGRARGFRGNAAAVVSLLDRLGVEQATVVGYSWAGGIALALAQDVPARVTSLVLVASVRPGEPLGRMDRMLAVPPIGAAVTATGLFLATNALALPPVRRAVQRRRRYLDQEAGTDEVGFRDSPDPDAVLTSMRSKGVWQSFVTEQRCLIDELPYLAPGLATITVPTLVLQGDSDHTVPPATGRRLAASIPGARLVELAATGHLVIHHRSEAVATAVRQLVPK